MNKRRWGFTLIELVIVIIIIGILAALGFTQYAKVVEKGRTAEAKIVLGSLRAAEQTNYLEKAAYVTAADLSVGAPTTCATTHYFSYDCTTAGLCTATRCTAGGKTPNFVGTAYTVTLTTDTGIWGGTAGYY